jgi:hypothetical protein
MSWRWELELVVEVRKREDGPRGGGTNTNPRLKTPIRTTLCNGGSGSVFNSGIGMMKIRMSVMTCAMPWTIQNQNRFSHVQIGA